MMTNPARAKTYRDTGIQRYHEGNVDQIPRDNPYPSKINELDWRLFYAHVVEREPYTDLATRHDTSLETARHRAIRAHGRYVALRRLDVETASLGDDGSILAAPISYSQLTALVRAGYRTIASVQRATDDELKRIPYIADTRLAQIRRAVASVTKEPYRAPYTYDELVVLLRKIVGYTITCEALANIPNDDADTIRRELGIAEAMKEFR